MYDRKPEIKRIASNPCIIIIWNNQSWGKENLCINIVMLSVFFYIYSSVDTFKRKVPRWSLVVTTPITIQD